VLLGNGTGGFSPADYFGVGTHPRSVITGDFNADGKLDVAVANGNSSNVTVLLGNGTGALGSRSDYFIDARPYGWFSNVYSVATGDFNEDGKPDIAAGVANSKTVAVLLGNGNGSFAAASYFTADIGVFSVTTGDFNSDGKLDLATANDSSNVSVLLGNGMGDFASGTNYGVGERNFTIAAGDFNSDGKPDLATANISSSNIYVLLNSPPCNTPPTANAGGPYQVNEGGAVSLSGAGTDVEGTALTYGWDLDANGTFETTGQNPIFSAAGLDGPTSRSVSLRVTDAAGLSAVSNATVNVLNVAPTLNSVTGPVAPQAVNTTINLTVNYTDPAGSLDTYTVTVNWGDGTTDNNTSHTYSAAGVYRIRATVADDDGGISNEAVYEYVVVYDPSAGFVTGGGWITSRAGAYTPNPSLTGRGTFGFVSKYQRGANQPTGNTEFQFHAGDFRFKSDSYEWLVVAGARAQYKGTGSVNGVSGYTFILTATDGQGNGGGGVDKFRIKIWNAGGVIYDNVMGGSDQINEANPQEIGGGSIVIHNP
jgi:hypothetical protein